MKNIKIISSAALIMSALGLTACGAQTGSESGEAAAPTKVVTVTAVVTPTPSAEAPSAAPSLPVTHAAAPHSKAPAKVYNMPNEVGAVLQDAQEDIEHILDVPFWPLLKSHDVKDGWRFQVSDRDWKICDQNPPVGATFDESTTIDFGVVKLDEQCP